VDTLALNHITTSDNYQINGWLSYRNITAFQEKLNVHTLSYVMLSTLFMPTLEQSRGMNVHARVCVLTNRQNHGGQ
jgi:hypothetical protein